MKIQAIIIGKFLLCLMVLIGCNKTEINQIIEDSNKYVFEIDTLSLYSSASEKTKQKSASQYYSILYADLYQTAIPPNFLKDVEILSQAFGDKQLFNEMVLSTMLNDLSVVLPTDSEMRNNLDAFVIDTYIRFYLRKPKEFERYYLTELIKNDDGQSVELLYTSFALSDEYLFY